MSIVCATVVEGRVVIDGRPLVDGTTVYVIEPDANAKVQIGGAELAELEAGVAEADLDDTTSEAELMERLRRIG